jgi:hypothetical protein
VDVNADIADPADLPSGAQPTSWRQQRGSLRSITVKFSERVAAVSAADLRLINLGVDAPNETDLEIALNDEQLTLVGHVLTIDLAGELIADGVFEFHVLSSITDSAGNPLDGISNGTTADFVMRGDGANKLFKLTADFNGDGGVSLLDLPTLQYWFGQSAPPAPDYVDLNRDGGLSVLDVSTIQSQFGKVVTFDPLQQSAGAAAVSLPVLIASLDAPVAVAPAFSRQQAVEHDASVATPPHVPLNSKVAAACFARYRPSGIRVRFLDRPWSRHDRVDEGAPDFLKADHVVASMKPTTSS